MKYNHAILCKTEEELYHVMKFFEVEGIMARASRRRQKIPDSWIVCLNNSQPDGIYLIIDTHSQYGSPYIGYNGNNISGRTYIKDNSMIELSYSEFLNYNSAKTYGLKRKSKSESPKNNDGRTSCFWCDSPTRKAGGGMYDVCTSCGK